MKDIFEPIEIIFIMLAIIVLFVLGANACTADKWNDGICPNCNIRYELRGISDAMKYYACPECGQEVGRY